MRNSLTNFKARWAKGIGSLVLVIAGLFLISNTNTENSLSPFELYIDETIYGLTDGSLKQLSSERGESEGVEVLMIVNPTACPSSTTELIEFYEVALNEGVSTTAIVVGDSFSQAKRFYNMKQLPMRSLFINKSNKSHYGLNTNNIGSGHKIWLLRRHSKAFFEIRLPSNGFRSTGRKKDLIRKVRHYDG